MPTLLITAAERKRLKASAHALKPVVLLGSAGLSDPVLQEIDRALAHHELIKVRLDGADRADRERDAEIVAERLSAAAVQIIGRILVLYRPAPIDEAATPAMPAPRSARRRDAEPPRRPPEGRPREGRAPAGKSATGRVTSGKSATGRVPAGRPPGGQTPAKRTTGTATRQPAGPPAGSRALGTLSPKPRVALRKGSITGIVSVAREPARGPAPTPAPRTRLSQRRAPAVRGTAVRGKPPARTRPPKRG
ncbi:MAG: ribosome assembly RNA-binding protein YhbY [Lautropia sp.]